MIMTAEEYSQCIKLINPDANVVIWQPTSGGEFLAKWDESHRGPKPTLEECEAVLPAIRAERQRAQAIDAIQTVLDAKAKQFGFDNIHTATVWTISKNPARKARADALVAWGDKVWDAAEAEWGKQEKGTPTYMTVEEFIAGLPEFVAP